MSNQPIFANFPPNKYQLAQPFAPENIARVRTNIALIISALRKGFYNAENNSGSYYRLGGQRFRVTEAKNKLSDPLVRDYQEAWIDTEAMMATIGVFELANELVPLIFGTGLNLKVLTGDEYMNVSQKVIFASMAFVNGQSSDETIKNLAEQLKGSELNVNVSVVATMISNVGFSDAYSIFCAAFFLAYALILVGGEPRYKISDSILGGEIIINWHDLIHSSVVKGYVEEFHLEEDEDSERLLPANDFIASRIELIEAVMKGRIKQVDFENSQLMMSHIKGFLSSTSASWMTYYLNNVVGGVDKSVLQTEILKLRQWSNFKKDSES